ncbi:hypothetical protein [Streptomyces sp. NPDC059092]|uniref:hypothetical protein n=1 Tax=Streptomyces sp. NPDC059092 TaxID=3346725 RepID=UPI0036A0BCE2
MFSVAWGVFATAVGWTVATDFRGAAYRLHALSHAATPFGGGGASVVGVGFSRVVAGVFALVGPVVLVNGLLDVWRGETGPDRLPSVPAWFVVVEAIFVVVFLWRMWRRSGVLRREWDTGSGLRRAGVAGITASAVAVVVTSGLHWGTGALLSWLFGCLCGIALLLGDRDNQQPDTETDSAGSSNS